MNELHKRLAIRKIYLEMCLNVLANVERADIVGSAFLVAVEAAKSTHSDTPEVSND